eukprot:74426-Pleurochrysis_carterae.AAC.1
MADACSRGRLQECYALCARLGVHPKRLQMPPDVAAFLGALVPEHEVFSYDLLHLAAGDVEPHPGPSGVLAVVASVLRDTHRPDPSPAPPVSAPLRVVARDLFLHAPMPRHPALARPDAVVPRPTPLPSPLPFAYGLTPTVAPSLDPCKRLPQFAEHDLSADSVRVHASNWTVVFRRSKRSETTRTPSKKTKRRGVGIGCHSRSFWVWQGGAKIPQPPTPSCARRTCYARSCSWCWPRCDPGASRIPPPGLPQATTSFGRFGGYTSGPVGTWSRRSICAAPYRGCSS